MVTKRDYNNCRRKEKGLFPAGHDFPGPCFSPDRFHHIYRVVICPYWFPWFFSFIIDTLSIHCYSFSYTKNVLFPGFENDIHVKSIA